MRYQFCVSATVTVDIEADNLEAARRKWAEFAYDLEGDQSVCRGPHTFYVNLADEEPTVYDGHDVIVVDPSAEG